MYDPRSIRFLLPVILLASACGGATAAPPQPAPAPAPMAGADAPPYAEADAEFMRDMIPHHAQALAMAALVDERTEDERIRLMAERIAVSQRDEIAMMSRWLEARGEPVPDPAHHAHADAAHAQMMGMLTQAQMERLAAARGEAFERLFLESMIQHHQGALMMVDRLRRTEQGGLEPEMFQIISHIDADQRAEIARMQAMLNTIQ